MKYSQIITSLLDNDFYKFTMGQLFLHQMTDMNVEWTYKNRDASRKFTKEMVDEIGKELKFTSLRYHRLDDMIDSVGIEPCKLCTYCWSGRE